MKKKQKSIRQRRWKQNYSKLKKRFHRALQTGTYHEWSCRKQHQLQTRLTRYAKHLLKPLPRLAGQTILGTALFFNPLHSSTSLVVDSISPNFKLPASVTPPQISLSLSPASIIEDGTSNLVYTFQRTGVTTEALIVNFSISGTAIRNTDYTLNGQTSFVTNTGQGTITIPVGNNTSELIIIPTPDTEFEDNESVIVKILTAPLVSSLKVPTLFGLVDIGYFSTPTFADIDADGDLDAFVGEFEDGIFYFENMGSPDKPSFAAIPNTDNPFDNNVGFNSKPTFTDIDADGDLDAFFGNSAGNVIFFENTGSSDSPHFFSTSNTDNPFDNISVNGFSALAFADIDADGDLDAFIGEQDGKIFYFENTGSSDSPSFATTPNTNNPFENIDVGNYSTPAFVDIDADGDLDAFIGEQDGKIFYFENTGSSDSPSFATTPNTNNPFENIDVGNYPTPTFADIDADGDFDTFIGGLYGSVFYFENTGNSDNPNFATTPNINKPFGNIDIGFNSTSTFVDIDADGDLDAFVGEQDGNINYFENIGNSSSPSLIIVPISDNPFGNANVGFDTNPTFVDIDADGDFDAFVGEQDGSINYFKNTGNSNSPSFATTSNMDNPFANTNVGFNAILAFADIDADGDFDAFIGERDGSINYFENTGNSNSPSFATTPNMNNPFSDINIARHSSPTFVDFDGDGDFDAFIGEQDGNINYFENIGNASSPNFTTTPNTDNPFGTADIGHYSIPTFVDIDADGDFDAFVGEQDGNINYFRNIIKATYKIDPNATTQTGIIQNDDAPLPIEWLNFTGHLTKTQQTQLNWKLSTTSKLKHFVVERSINGQQFEEIAMIDATDIAVNETVRYAYLDKAPQTGLNYYRIQTVEQDGASAYSSVVVVQLNQSTVEGNLILYPNPNNGQVTLQLPVIFDSSTGIELTILNTIGQVIAYQKQVSGLLNHRFHLPTAHLPKGIYLVQVRQGEIVEVARMVMK